MESRLHPRHKGGRSYSEVLDAPNLDANVDDLENFSLWTLHSCGRNYEVNVSSWRTRSRHSTRLRGTQRPGATDGGFVMSSVILSTSQKRVSFRWVPTWSEEACDLTAP